jgi:RimJ/RimL family protein N-acetyltransferase
MPAPFTLDGTGALCHGIGHRIRYAAHAPATMARLRPRAIRGRGLATEAARGALRVGFGPLSLPEVVSFTAVRNGRSRAVMERIGMRNAGEDFEHPAVPEGSPLRLHCLYRITRSQWNENAH